MLKRGVRNTNGMMNFRTLLSNLSNLEEEGFISRFIAFHLKKPVKEISNDLRRMHRMGFLRRKRVKRLCFLKNGQSCYKGYEYIYVISKQGKNYLKWMREKRSIENLAYIKLQKEIADYLPQELQNRILQKVSFRSLSKYKGPNRHFRLIDNELFFITNTISENQKLAKANLNLIQDYLSLFKENIRLKSRLNALNLLKIVYQSYIKSNQIYIDQYIQQERENMKDIVNYLNERVEESREKDRRFLFKFTNYQSSLVDVYQNSRNRFVTILRSSLPEDKFIKIMKFASELEDKELADGAHTIEIV